jgi:hypothetical protein
MDRMHRYRIEVQGRVGEKEVNAASPLRACVVDSDDAVTSLSLTADQSGLVGWVRHLHGRGYTLLSVRRESRGPVPGVPEMDSVVAVERS